MIIIAIKNFFKEFFVVEVEEDAPAGSKSKNKKTAAPSGSKPKAAETKSNVTRLDLSRNDSNSTDTTTEKDRPATQQDDSKTQRAFFKKERQKPGKTKPEQREKKTPDRYKETTLMNADNTNAKVHLFEPRVFSETQDIADELKNERATLVNLSKVDAGPKKRIVDFLSGTVYALDGDIQKVGNDIFLCTPKSVIVEGEISSDKENPDEM